MISILLLVATIGRIFSLSAWAVNSEQPIKVMTFNTGLVCVGPGCILAEEDHPHERAPLIGHWLKAQASDLVFLQEVFSPRDFEVIRKESGHAYAATPDATSGLAIFSKYPISDFGFDPFEWQGSNYHDCKRLVARVIIGVATATITLPTKRIRVVTMHQLARWQDVQGFALPSDQITPERKLILLKLRKLLDRQDPNLPLIVAGDFNMNQKSEEYPFFERIIGLQDAFRTAKRKDWKSFCTFCPDNAFVKAQDSPGEGILDYIWVKPKSVQVERADILPDAKPLLSDHRAVAATLRFEKNIGRLPESKPLDGEIAQLRTYFEKVEFSKFCWFTSPTAWTQRKAALEFLRP